MADEGHTLASHTMTHKNITRMSDEELKAELAGLEALCLDVTGHEMARLFRPPVPALTSGIICLFICRLYS
jgi:peptidoglycan-N-acetylmuramic acid deacetylase